MTEIEERAVKLLVWDLDDTLWRGILLEGDTIQLREEVKPTLITLDERGILHSIASKNDPELAMAKLNEFGVAGYFLYPQVNWNSKATNIRAIVNSINIGIEAVAFIDDDPFEREEVEHSLPDILTLDASELKVLTERREFKPHYITEDSARRRMMYQADLERKSVEEGFVGPKEEFLASLKMKLHIAPAQEQDLKRAEELTARTNQLNTTGYTYSYDELNGFRQTPGYLLLMASLHDKYGPYGKIGLVLVESMGDVWTIKLLLMSCRVATRGVGTILMNHVLQLARHSGVRLRAEFRPNGRNRLMFVSYKFCGFEVIERRQDLLILEHNLQRIQPFPDWLEIRIQT
jgi:FkbH-like protein